MADATAKLNYGSGSCQHVTAEITINKETRKYVFMADELTNEAETDIQFQTALANLKTNARLNSTKTLAEKKTAIEGATFKV